MSEIYKKLMKVQQELKVPKNQYNKFGKYYFRSCEDIMEAVKPVLAKHNCAMKVGDELVQKGDRYYVEARVFLIDLDSGETTENRAYARESEDKKGMDKSQITGTASSYARKYALDGMFALDESKDADATNKHGKDKKSSNGSNGNNGDLITEETEQKINDLLQKFYDKAGNEYSDKQVRKKLYSDFADEKGWKKFFISDSTKESMAQQFVSYLQNRLNK